MSYNNESENVHGTAPQTQTEQQHHQRVGLESMSDEVFRQAVIDHAKFLGIDPETESDFLWLAEEALLAELPKDWELFEDDQGNYYYYNHHTGESSWENPLDEPYRQLFQKLRNDPQHATPRDGIEYDERKPKPKDWGRFPGEAQIAQRARQAKEARDKELAIELGMDDEQDEKVSDFTIQPPVPPFTPDSSAVKAVRKPGDEDDEYIEAILDHREEHLPDGSVDVQYLVKWGGTSATGDPGESDEEWFSGCVLLPEHRELLEEYNTKNSLVYKEPIASPFRPRRGDGTELVRSLEIELNVSRIAEQQAREEVQRLSEDLEQQRELAAKADDRYRRLRSELNQGTTDQFESIVNAHGIELEEERRLTKLAREQVESLEKRVEELSQEKSRSAAEVATLRLSFQQQLEERDEKIAQLQIQVSEGANANPKKEALRSAEQSHRSKNIQSEIALFREKLGASERQCERLVNERNLLQDVLEKLKRELDKELTTNLSGQQETGKLKVELERTVREKRRAQDALHRAENEQKVTREKLGKLEEKDAKCAELEAQVKFLQNKLDGLKSLPAPAASPQDAPIIDKSECLKQLEDEKRALQAKLDTLNSALRERDDTLTELQAEIISTREQLDAESRKSQRLHTERQVLEDALAKVKEELTREVDENGNLRKSFASMTERHETELKRARSEYRQLGASTQREMESLNAELETANAEVNSLKEKLQSLVAERTKTSGEETKLRVEAEQLLESTKNELQTAHASLERSTKQREQLEAMLEELRSKLETKEQELSKCSADMVNERERADEATRRIGRCESEMQILKSSIEATKEELDCELKANDALRRDLQDKSDRIEAYEHDTKRRRDDTDWEQKCEALVNKFEEKQAALQDCEKRLADSQKREKELLESVSHLKDQVKCVKANTSEVNRLEKALARCKEEMEVALAARAKQADMERESAVSELNSRIKQLEEESKQNLDSSSSSKAQLEDVRRRLFEESQRRRKLHNKLVELQGNIRVYCRVRPVLQHELNSGKGGAVVSCEQETGEIAIQQSFATRDSKDTFEFDQVYGPESSQTQVFADVEPLAMSVLDGYDVCIFAYGQTGSGKTFTMDGTEDNRGVNHRTLESIFTRIKDHRQDDTSYTVQLSVLEIYNETIRDLLADNQTNQPKLEIRYGEQGLYVPGLTLVSVQSIEDVERQMELGSKNRTVGAHNINAHSSRSHLVVSVNVLAKHMSENETKYVRGKLHLIDLAGSERLNKTEASGERLKEAKCINKSLSALGNVIQALSTGPKKKQQQHVPFRDSKLTYLLQESLSGSSKVLMFVNISPVEWNAPESLCSLKFAARCRAVTLGQAKKNVESQLVAQLRQTIESLQGQLQQHQQKLQ